MFLYLAVQSVQHVADTRSRGDVSAGTICAEGAVGGSSTYIGKTIIQLSKNTFNIHNSRFDTHGLWEAVHGLSIKSMTLTFWNERLDVKLEESLMESLSSLKQLETLSIDMYDSPGLWKALNGLNIKC